jgi:hypothetical protein
MLGCAGCIALFCDCFTHIICPHGSYCVVVLSGRLLLFSLRCQVAVDAVLLCCCELRLICWLCYVVVFYIKLPGNRCIAAASPAILPHCYIAAVAAILLLYYGITLYHIAAVLRCCTVVARRWSCLLPAQLLFCCALYYIIASSVDFNRTEHRLI